MNTQLVDSKTLKTITGYKRDGDMYKNLTAQGIKTFNSPNGIWTTVGLIEKAGLKSPNLVKYF
jgi:hypothetical protein